MHFVYLVKCADNSLYCGYTNNLEKRIKTHNLGKASKYTRAHLPVKLVYFEKFSSLSKALSREYEIKQFTRKKKEELISKNHS
ncbi:MAG: GIY-YIG nuclease family protein [archaeon]|jgi:putative endonuclease